MASRSPSRSEGEVLSSDSEANLKANTSQSCHSNTKVDRHARPALTPYAPPAKRPRSRSRSRPRSRSCSRSRSPYRRPRGHKRAREEDRVRERPRHDPRKFHPRYEDQRSSRHPYGSRDRGESRRSRTYSRSPSHSPYRHSRTRSREATAIKSKPRGRSRDRGSQSVDLATAVEQSRLDQQGKHTATLSANTQVQKRDDSQSRYDTAMSASQQSAQTRSLRDAPPPLHEDAGSPVVLDEAALIEQRRKRREAIKNKYRGQGTALLVQALHSSTDTAAAGLPSLDSAASSPGQWDQQCSTNANAAAASESASLPCSPPPCGPTPRMSPTSFASPGAEDWTNGGHGGRVGSPTEDGRSAADYDPTIDMQEERARHDKRLFKEEDQPLPEAAQASQDQDWVQAADPAPANPKHDFDMFAEDDDDDDMFAEAPSVKPKPDSKAAQALDAHMMDNWDDHQGYYITILGELMDNRYQVSQNLGRGMFSSVIRATDSDTNQVVAIKVVRSNESMRKAGFKEIDILRDLAANDPEDRKHVIRLLRSFDHKGHLCMVFENLWMNLREVLKKFGRDVGINLKAIRAYAQQLFLGLGLLRKCQYLHADLKPDNILVNEARNVVKICDLGSASPISENVTAPYLISRFYRAPEIILGIPYDYGIDMWSIGCTLFELYTGKILFTGRNNNNMLKAIMDCRGKFPHKLLRRGALTYDHFDDLLNFKAEEADKVTGRIVTKLIDIKAKPVRDLRSRLLPKDKRMDESERREVELFLDLLDKCLDLRPEKRLTPNEALKHAFILRTKP